MDMFLDQHVKEMALGKMTPAGKETKMRLTGQTKKDWGARISVGLIAITYGYAIGPQCLAWAYRTWLEKERKREAKQRAGRFEIIRLHDKVNMVLAKGVTPDAGKWDCHIMAIKIITIH
jgi:hypothetical protein